MHPEVTDAEQSSCPKCGMKLIPADQVPGAGEGDQHHGQEGHGPGHDHADGLEWEDLMPEINRQTNTTNMIWRLVDKETEAENAGITWAFRVGDRVKIRLANEMDQEHPMHHPFHIHGAGRFLVLSRDGEPEGNFVWKDTVLLRAGQTIDILLGRHQPRPLDGSLPHRRTHRERDDVQLRRRAGGRRRFQLARRPPGSGRGCGGVRQQPSTGTCAHVLLDVSSLHRASTSSGAARSDETRRAQQKRNLRCSEDWAR